MFNFFSKVMMILARDTVEFIKLMIGLLFIVIAICQVVLYQVFAILVRHSLMMPRHLMIFRIKHFYTNVLGFRFRRI